jgi:hypothetical protein
MKEYLIYYITLGAIFYFIWLIFKPKENQQYDSLVNEFKFVEVMFFFIIVFLYPLFFLIALFRFIKKKQHLVSIFLSSLLVYCSILFSKVSFVIEFAQCVNLFNIF